MVTLLQIITSPSVEVRFLDDSKHGNADIKQIHEPATRKDEADNDTLPDILCLHFFALWALVFKPVWPMTIGGASLALMVTIVFYRVLKSRRE